MGAEIGCTRRSKNFLHRFSMNAYYRPCIAVPQLPGNAPVWQGVETQEYSLSSKFSQRRQTGQGESPLGERGSPGGQGESPLGERGSPGGWIGIPKWEVIVSRALSIAPTDTSSSPGDTAPVLIAGTPPAPVIFPQGVAGALLSPRQPDHEDSGRGTSGR